MKIKAYAKINPYLHVVGTLPSGMHCLKTVIQPIELCDSLDIDVLAGNGKIDFCCDVSEFDNDDNLVVKACKTFAERTGLCFDVSIKLYKVIPSGAGLGGGSADAAAVLCYLNEHFERPLSEDELVELGYTLGWDVPPLVMGGRVLVDEGGAEPRLVRLKDPVQAEIVIIKPPFSVNTAEAFRRFDELGGANSADENHLERASGHADEIAEIKRKLLSLGAEEALMTGSGSAVFGRVAPAGISYADSAEKRFCSSVIEKEFGDEYMVFLTRYFLG